MLRSHSHLLNGNKWTVTIILYWMEGVMVAIDAYEYNLTLKYNLPIIGEIISNGRNFQID